MEGLNDFDMKKILPILQSFGISPSNLGPEKLERLMKISKQVSEPSKVSAEVSREVMNILGIGLAGKKQSTAKKIKVGRNDKCPCNSGKKFKKCCENNQK